MGLFPLLYTERYWIRKLNKQKQPSFAWLFFVKKSKSHQKKSKLYLVFMQYVGIIKVRILYVGEMQYDKRVQVYKRANFSTG